MPWKHWLSFTRVGAEERKDERERGTVGLGRMGDEGFVQEVCNQVPIMVTKFYLSQIGGDHSDFVGRHGLIFFLKRRRGM